MRIYLLIAAIAGGVTWLVTPLIRHVAIHIGAVGEVRARDVHTIPTPRMGGLGMLIGFAFAMIYSSRIAFTTGLFENNNQEWVILAGAVLISGLVALTLLQTFSSAGGASRPEEELETYRRGVAATGPSLFRAL